MVIYEYLLNKGKFYKLSHDANIEYHKKKYCQDTLKIYSFKAGKSQFRTWVREEELGEIKASRIFTLEDDDEKYRSKLITYYKKHIEKYKKDLQRAEDILGRLESEDFVWKE